MLNELDFHGQDAPDETLEKVVISAVGDYALGTVNFPAGFVMSDFEYIEFASCTDGGSIIWDTDVITKEAYLGGLTDLRLSRTANNLGSNYELSIQNITTTSFDVVIPSSAVTTSRLYYAIGYKKRYTTKNLSTIVNVNGGNDIVVATRYEVDIVTEIGSEYLGKQLIVEAEIYYDGSSGGDAGWKKYPQANWQNTSGTQHNVGLEAIQEDDVIAIYTAGYGGTGSSWFINGDVQNPWNVTDGNSINTAPCRLKVWVVDQYIVNLSGGGGSSPGVPTYLVRTEDTSGALSNGYLMDVSSGGLQFTLPASPEAGDWISVGDYNGTCSILAPIVITSASENIHGSTEDLVITNPNTVLTLSYVDATEGWKIVDGIGEGNGSGDLPYEEIDLAPLGYTTGDVSLPDGYTWNDIDYISVGLGNASGQVRQYDNDNIPALLIDAALDSAIVGTLVWDNANTTNPYGIDIRKVDDSTLSIEISADANVNSCARYIKAYTKYKPVLNKVDEWVTAHLFGTIVDDTNANTNVIGRYVDAYTYHVRGNIVLSGSTGGDGLLITLPDGIATNLPDNWLISDVQIKNDADAPEDRHYLRVGDGGTTIRYFGTRTAGTSFWFDAIIPLA